MKINQHKTVEVGCKEKYKKKYNTFSRVWHHWCCCCCSSNSLRGCVRGSERGRVS